MKKAHELHELHEKNKKICEICGFSFKNGDFDVTLGSG
jgi:hypothetical protein